MCFSPHLWIGCGGGGGTQWSRTRPAYAVSHPGQLKNRSFQHLFLDMVTTHNDEPSYVKHVLGRINVFFTLFGYWGGGGKRALLHNVLM